MTDTPTKAGNAEDALLDLLRCPVTLSPLRREGDVLVAEVGGLRYAVRDGIPQMIADEAELPAGVATLDELKKQLREQGHEVRD
jgi:uncharacterized protein YbaR (Trm112 family)